MTKSLPFHNSRIHFKSSKSNEESNMELMMVGKSAEVPESEANFSESVVRKLNHHSGR
ncbi:hypothetical protein D3C74_493430 [compost metagenome]